MSAAAILLVGVGTVSVQLAHDNDLLTTHAATGTDAAVLQLFAPLALVGVGIVIWFGQASGSVGPAILGAAVAFMAPVWVAWDGSNTLLRSAAAVAAPFLLACLVDVATGYPDRGVRSARCSRLVTSGYVVTAAYAVLRSALYDPFLDPDCWVKCDENTFLVRAAPGVVDLLDLAWAGAATLFGAGMVLFGAVVVTTRLTGGLEWPVVIASTVGVVTQAAQALIWPGIEDPRREVLQVLFLVEAWSLVALAVALAWSTWRRERRRAALGRLAEVAGEAAGIHSLAEALADATGRADLELAYWVPAAQRHVDETGRPLARGPKDGDVSVLRGDLPVAMIRTGGRATSVALVAGALGPAARLALDNERLRAEELYHVQRLAESRARVVAASDRARRGLERDLHDGAQQRLLAVMYSLQMAATAARDRGDSRQVDSLELAVDECRKALEELRDLAHGVFPAILDTAGLAAALAHLGDRGRAVLSVDDRTHHTLPGPVAHAVYLAVAWALAAAAQDDDRPLRVGLEHTGDLFVVTIDGSPQSEYVRTADRVGALGGRVFADDGLLRLEIPCD